MMSPQPAFAATLTMMAAVGLVVTWRNSRPLCVVLGFLLVFYSVFFALQAVFIVRNFLLLLPVLAYLAAVGIDFALGCAKGLPGPLPRAAATSILVLAFTIMRARGVADEWRVQCQHTESNRGPNAAKRGSRTANRSCLRAACRFFRWVKASTQAGK